MHPIMQYRSSAAVLVMCAIALLLCSAQALATPSSWFDDEAAASTQGAPSIRVSLGEQRAYFYKGDKLVGVSRVSSGKSGFKTPTGHFKVKGKKREHRSTLYGSYLDRNTHMVVRSDVDTRKDRRPPGTYYRGADMDYFIRFNGAVGFHASGDVPNYPASHGCVRMPRHMAQKFFQYAPVGTPVIVTH